MTPPTVELPETARFHPEPLDSGTLAPAPTAELPETERFRTEPLDSGTLDDDETKDRR
ncbi:hypothetical protein [Agrococcus sp. ProA11]|uniref:hypothetical protein n=1 Tax=Agrococcus chionoecetis TaxID=3153752 RepID=UPI003261BC3A